MSSHKSDELIEQFSMGTLQEPELSETMEHLLHCEECQDAVSHMDQFLASFKSVSETESLSATPLHPEFKGEYLLVQAVLSTNNIENIGVGLFHTSSDTLYCRFRRDFEEFAGNQADLFKHLCEDISETAHELGGQKCIDWIKSTLPNTVRLSKSKNIRVENGARAVDRLYEKYLRPKILRFRTHLPQYSLEAAAGRFGMKMEVEPEGWVEVRSEVPLTEDMFVTHVKGHSMEPTIPNASLCVFRSNIVQPLEGKVLLIEQYGESGGSRYTVKRWNVSKDREPNEQSDEAPLHQHVTLTSINTDYEPLDVASAGKIRVLGEFLFVV